MDTVFQRPVNYDGLGSEQAGAAQEIIKLIADKKVPEAEEKLKAVREAFRNLMADPNRTYVCFKSEAQFNAYAKVIEETKSEEDAAALVRVSMAFADAIHAQAFIASGRKQWKEALELLDLEMSCAPYDPHPYGEKGYVLNTTGKNKEAVAAYEKALELATKYDGTAAERASALRGIGFAQTELWAAAQSSLKVSAAINGRRNDSDVIDAAAPGQLAAAKAAYNESLKLEPGNPIALAELKYIQGLETPPKAAPAPPKKSKPKTN